MGFSSLILLRQSDFKCLVAYSSVLHINFCFIGILGFSFISYFGSIFIGISHAFTSPIIFCVFIFRIILLVVVKFYSFAHSILVKFSNYFSFSLYFTLRFPILKRF